MDASSGRSKILTPRIPHSVESTVIDLSHEIGAASPIWPGVPKPELRVVPNTEQGVLVQEWNGALGIGTHVDAPAHVIPGGRTIDEIPLGQLTGSTIVIDVESFVSGDDLTIRVEGILAWESRYGPIPPLSIILIRTGWSLHWPQPVYYSDGTGMLRFPGLDADAASLLANRHPKIIGIDSPSLDFSGCRHMDAHRIILGADIPQVENLNNLHLLPPFGATTYFAVLRLIGATEAPCRAFAIL